MLSAFSMLLLACSPKSFYGLYGECSDPYACIQLLINEDSTFIYYSFIDVGGEAVTSGTWTKSKDTLTLNGQPLKDICRMRVIEEKSDSLRNFRVSLHDSIEGQMPFGKINIFSEGRSQMHTTDFDGYADFSIESGSFDSIIIYSPISEECKLTYHVKNINSNLFIIRHSYRPLLLIKDDKWLIRKNKVTNITDSKGRTDENYFIFKTSIDKKAWN